MNIKIKNYLGIAIIAVLFIFALSVMSYVNSYSKSIQPSSFRSFSASGEGKITAIPDIAQFTFSVITEGGKDIAKLQKENTDKTNKIINFAKLSGVVDKDIKTQNYNLDPRYQYYSCPISREAAEPCPPAEIVGYTITQTIAVKIRNFEKIGDIMAGVVQNGANSVSQLSFNIDDLSVIQDKAREEAIKKAKERAKLIAEAGDFKVGKLLSIDEGGYSEPIYGYGIGGFAKTAMETSLPAPQIEPGSQEIKVNVILRYEIE
ncbi:MAG: SIMPL domain-containing protein [Patescibacteria group bacterium]|nr:SIMPL domain-containing protein [Patescibacteria group bacterium]